MGKLTIVLTDTPEDTMDSGCLYRIFGECLKHAVVESAVYETKHRETKEPVTIDVTHIAKSI